MDEESSIVGRPRGKLQVIAGNRKRFAGKRERLFLEHLAATCNVTRSAAAAGVSVQCAYRRRMKDEAFRCAWAEAIEQGYARLEAVLLERAGRRRRSLSTAAWRWRPNPISRPPNSCCASTSAG